MLAAGRGALAAMEAALEGLAWEDAWDVDPETDGGPWWAW